MLQYKIPQEVGIADKIVGPFSLRQLIIVAIGVGISYVLFAITSKLYELNILEYIIIALPALIAIAAAMIKINNIPLPKFVLLALEFAIKPKKRMWDHRGISAIVAPDLSEKKSATEKAVIEEKGRNDVNLEDLSRVLDSGGFEHVEEIKHEGIDQAEDDNLMIEAFFGHKEGTGANIWARTTKDKSAYNRKLKLLSELPMTEVKALKEVKEQIELIKKEESKAVPPVPTITETKPKESAVKTEITPPKQPVTPKPEKPLYKQPDKQTDKQPNKPLDKQTDKQPNKPLDKQLDKPSDKQPDKPLNKQPDKPLDKPLDKQPTPREAEKDTRKRRRRKKKPKFAQPVRPETQIDSTQKKKPVNLIQKEQQKPIPKDEKPITGNIIVSDRSDTSSQPSVAQAQREQVKDTKPATDTKSPESVKEAKPEKKQEDKGGEIHLEELQKGEIELNLD